jgi:hypothetical protein
MSKPTNEKDNRFYSYLSATTRREYWTVRLVKDITPMAALVEAIENLERGKPIAAVNPEDVIMDVEGEPINVIPLAQR